MIVRFPIYLCDLNDSAQKEYCRCMNIDEDRKKYLMKRIVPIATRIADVYDSQDISNLNLTVRTENVIRRCDILKINELTKVLSVDPYLIMGARNMGKKSWEELLRKIRPYLDTDSLPQYSSSISYKKPILEIIENVRKILNGE